MDNRPIGVFDSGIGGLTVWRALVKLLPHESTVYIADQAHIPYGEKSAAFIRGRVEKAIAFFLKKDVKLIVVACNTATIAGIDMYRKKFPAIPIVGTVPVIKTAAEKTKTGKIVLLATHYAAKSRYVKQLIRKFAAQHTVIRVGATELVHLVESGIIDGEVTAYKLSHILSPLKDKHADVLVLGCTHFPFLYEKIRAIVGDNMQIVESGGAIARQVERISIHNEIAASVMQAPLCEFFTTGDSQQTTFIATALMKESMPFRHVFI